MPFVPAVFESLDERFGAYRGDSRLEVIYSAGRWLEGPVYVPAGRYLLFSDIPNDRIMRWDETTGAVGVFRQPSRFANGHTLDREGRLVSCEHGGRRVSRTEHDGTVTALVERTAEGRRFNSPNDVVVRSDGSVWFTDPPYGIDSDYEGHRADSEIGTSHVYRYVPSDGSVLVVADDFDRPNGLAFSEDETELYVVDTPRRHIRRFDVDVTGGLTGGEVLAECDAGTFDGLRIDTLGRIWVAAGDGLHCIDHDGTLLGKLRLPEVASNLTFGGPARNVLFATATTSLYALRLTTTGVGTGPLFAG